MSTEQLILCQLLKTFVSSFFILNSLKDWNNFKLQSVTKSKNIIIKQYKMKIFLNKIINNQLIVVIISENS